MTYEIIFTSTYEKRAKKFFNQHSNLLPTYEKILNLLELNPKHPSLRLHKLNGKLQHLHSISINMQYRIILEFLIRGNEILLIDIGEHDAVYRK